MGVPCALLALCSQLIDCICDNFGNVTKTRLQTEDLYNNFHTRTWTSYLWQFKSTISVKRSKIEYLIRFEIGERDWRTTDYHSKCTMLYIKNLPFWTRKTPKPNWFDPSPPHHRCRKNWTPLSVDEVTFCLEGSSRHWKTEFRIREWAVGSKNALAKKCEPKPKSVKWV